MSLWALECLGSWVLYYQLVFLAFQLFCVARVLIRADTLSGEMACWYGCHGQLTW